MRFKSFALATLASISALFVPAVDGNAKNAIEQFSASFSGFQELGALNAETGAIFSPGQGTLLLSVDKGNRIISFTLTFSGLSAPVTQSHIHFGKRHVPGGIMVFFCSNLLTAPAGTQPCPASGGTVTGTIAAANVLAIAGQNFPAGNFDALVAAIESKTAYGNIHTTAFTAGEIRGQIHPSDQDDEGS